MAGTVRFSLKAANSGYFGTRFLLVVPIWYHISMPPKIRELIEQLKDAGFVNRGGKGSHRNFMHPSGVRITVSGNPGNDAKPYQIRDVKRALDGISK